MNATTIRDVVDGRAHQRLQWFRDHYGQAADDTVAVLREGGIALEGLNVADVGCGEGITDLGIVHKSKPARLVGFDINDTSREHLAECARAAGLDGSLPAELEFVTSEPERLPAEGGSFDVVVTWSAFEHVANPRAVLREIRRILRPNGTLFLQLWPFYWSEHGSHLWQWFPEGFCQVRFSDEEICERLRSDTETDRDWIEMRINDYQTLNGITLDDLQGDLREAGFRVARLEVMSPTVNLPSGADDWPLSALAIAGVKLLATPTEPRGRAPRPVGRNQR